jgi:hypothetical protein
MLMVLVAVLLASCTSQELKDLAGTGYQGPGYYQRDYTTNNVPLSLRQPPTNECRLIGKNDPQPDTSTYMVLGEVSSFCSNITPFERRGKGALELLPYEGRKVGADAIINIEWAETIGGGYAKGTAIRFVERGVK